MKNKKLIIKFVVLAIIFVFLVNPAWLPISADSKTAVSTELSSAFSIFADGESGALSLAKLISAAAAAVLTYLLTSLACLILSAMSAGKNRTQTVAGLLNSLIKTVGIIAGFVWALSILGVNLGAIFASLGVVSLIIGFGVQSLIEDCVTGIFIIMEGTYNIGDIIVLDDFRGTVRKITMRTTTMEDAGGNLKVINNSDIRNIQNRSNAESIAVTEIGIGYDADLRHVEKIINDNLPAIYERNSDIFDAVPTYGGVQALADSAVVLRVFVSVKEQNFFPATRRLNREMKLLFDDNGIEIPFNQIVVHTAN